MIELITFLVLIAVGYTSGTLLEKRHYISIRKREALTLTLPALPTDCIDSTRSVESVKLVAGSTAIALDYFKSITGRLKNLFGGRVTAYETLLDRARRESILRMKAEAEGYDVIINVCLETSSIGGEAQGRRKIQSVECYAYGTAIKYARS